MKRQSGPQTRPNVPPRLSGPRPTLARMADLPLRLFHIAYSPETLAAMEPGYELLDNLDNARPDWFEYWSIRRWLLTEALDETLFYGFFSPKFRAKTGLGAEQVAEQLRQHGAQSDVLLFSPFPTQIACYLNIFEQGEVSHPGFMQTCMEALQAIGRPAPLPQLVMDCRQTVFSNYFVARPAFWREWLSWTEPLFALCEDPGSEIGARLRRETAYAGSVQLKVFLIERIASLLLTLQPQWRVTAHDPFGFRHPSEPASVPDTLALCSEALKQAFRNQGFDSYLQAFLSVRRSLLQSSQT